jgi:hypothetical protein
MAYNFKECNRDQIYLLPSTLQESAAKTLMPLLKLLRLI